MRAFYASTAPTSRSIHDGFYWAKYKISAPGKEREIAILCTVAWLSH